MRFTKEELHQGWFEIRNGVPLFIGTLTLGFDEPVTYRGIPIERDGPVMVGTVSMKYENGEYRITHCDVHRVPALTPADIADIEAAWPMPDMQIAVDFEFDWLNSQYRVMWVNDHQFGVMDLGNPQGGARMSVDREDDTLPWRANVWKEREAMAYTMILDKVRNND